MGSLLTILFFLFLALIIIVFLVERFGKHHSPEELSGLRRWILPLIMLLLVLQAIRHFFF